MTTPKPDMRRLDDLQARQEWAWLKPQPFDFTVGTLQCVVGPLIKILHDVHQDGKRLTWRKLLAEAQAELTEEVHDEDWWPADQLLLDPPLYEVEEGSLGERQWRVVAAVLEAVGGCETCFASVFAMSEVWEIDIRDADGLRRIPENPMQTGPNHVWATDHSWAVTSDVDCSFSILTGSNDFVAQLLQHPELECVAIRPECSTLSEPPTRRPAVWPVRSGS